jgi:hypothetical protein
VAQKTNFTVVRNRGYDRGGFAVRERHNERKNADYGNGDICPEREHLNVHFLQRIHATDGTPATYQQTYEQMLSQGTIVEKGLRSDAKVFAELVFDVNTDYFERNGGYDFAVKFYEEAYRVAVKEIGGEQYILSAVMHADERNSALSKEAGTDQFHYHLHVVYVPVVQKEVLWSKRTKDKSLVGKVKEVIPQVSHSKKWPIRVQVERSGKMVTLNSYSLLKDRYFEHMKAAGFEGFERGERGSTKEHLEVLDYKIQQDEKRLEALEVEIHQKETAVAVLDRQAENKEKQIEKFDAKLEVKQTKAATVDEINAMGHSLPLVPGIHFSDDEAARLKKLARQSVKLQEQIKSNNAKMKKMETELNEVKAELDSRKKKEPTLMEQLNWWQKFIQAMRRAPKRLKDVVEDILRKPPEKEVAAEIYREEQLERERLAKAKSKTTEVSR